MFHFHIATLVACRQEQGGTRGKENEVGGGKKGRKEELRTPLQASEQVWTAAARVEPALRSAYSVKRYSLHGLLQRCSDTTSVTELHWMIVKVYLYYYYYFLELLQGGTGDWEYCSVSPWHWLWHWELGAGYATGGKVGSGRLWPGARSRDPQVRWGWGGEMVDCTGLCGNLCVCCTMI